MSGAPRPIANGGDPDSPWSGARVLLLIDHYRRGLSANESAALIGGVSKNAVISKRRRLGLFAVAAAPCPPGGGESRPRERVRPLRVLRGPRSLPVTPLPDMDLPPPPNADPKSLSARRSGECAWPLGAAEAEGDHRTLFCAAPVEQGGRYCPNHAARAYRRTP